MNNGSGNRLDRVEALVESNARAIQALADQISEIVHVQAEAQQEREELRQATIGIANLINSLDSDRPTILRRLNTIENKIDQLLENNGDGPQA